MAEYRVTHLGPGDLTLFRELNRVFSVAFDDPEAYEGKPPA